MTNQIIWTVRLMMWRFRYVNSYVHAKRRNKKIHWKCRLKWKFSWITSSKTLADRFRDALFERNGMMPSIRETFKQLGIYSCRKNWNENKISVFPTKILQNAKKFDVCRNGRKNFTVKSFSSENIESMLVTVHRNDISIKHRLLWAFAKLFFDGKRGSIGWKILQIVQKW